LIGQTTQQDAPPRVVFVAFEIGLGAPTIVAMLRRVVGPTPISLLLAGQSDLEFRLALEDAGVVALPVSEPLMDDSTAPFRLDPHLLTSTRSRPRLVLRQSRRSVTFDGRSKVLSPQPFKLLLFMLTEAQEGRPLIDNRSIEDELWGTAIHARQVGDAIRRLRDALAPVLGGRGEANELIQNRPGSYFINQDFALIEIV
jgi:DNA-binding response OmpR family regulator